MVEPTHLKNIRQNRNLPQIGVKRKNTGNHHLTNDVTILASVCICVFLFGGGRETNLWRDGLVWFHMVLLAKLQSWWSKTPPKQLLTPHKQHAQNLEDLAS